MSSLPKVSLLILGAGWTWPYLETQCERAGITTARTTRDGRNGSIRFTFDQDSTDSTAVSALPSADTVLITFPLTHPGAATRLTTQYAFTHASCTPRWILLGSTGAFPASSGWVSARTPVDPDSSPRVAAEAELLALEGVQATVLHLAGLYGGSRDPRNWIGRVASSKERLKSKGALHLVHGADVALAVVAVAENSVPFAGCRWIVSDRRLYDWWDIALTFGAVARERRADADSGEWEFERWVGELMREVGVRALPRAPDQLGRCVDSTEFWETAGLMPSRGNMFSVVVEEERAAGASL